MTPIPQDLLTHLEKTDVQTYISLNSPHASTSRSSESWSIMTEALKQISDVLAKHDDKAALRLTIRDLGGIDWSFPSSSVSMVVLCLASDTNRGAHGSSTDFQEIMRFLHCVKTLVMQKSVGVLITFPSELCRAPPPGEKEMERWTEKLGWGVDALLELRGFGGKHHPYSPSSSHIIRANDQTIRPSHLCSTHFTDSCLFQLFQHHTIFSPLLSDILRCSVSQESPVQAAPEKTTSDSGSKENVSSWRRSIWV